MDILLLFSTDVFTGVTGETAGVRSFDGFDPVNGTDIVETLLWDDDQERTKAEPLFDAAGTIERRGDVLDVRPVGGGDGKGYFRSRFRTLAHAADRM